MANCQAVSVTICHQMSDTDSTVTKCQVTICHQTTARHYHQLQGTVTICRQTTVRHCHQLSGIVTICHQTTIRHCHNILLSYLSGTVTKYQAQSPTVKHCPPPVVIIVQLLSCYINCHALFLYQL